MKSGTEVILYQLLRSIAILVSIPGNVNNSCFLSPQGFARKHTDPFWINYRGPSVHFDSNLDWEVGTVVQDVRWVTYHATTMTDEIEAMQENGTTSSKLKRSYKKRFRDPSDSFWGSA